MKKKIIAEKINAGHKNMFGKKLTVSIEIPISIGKVISIADVDYVLLTEYDAGVLLKELIKTDKALYNKLFE